MEPQIMQENETTWFSSQQINVERILQLLQYLTVKERNILNTQ
jgi:hypothetical protein